LEFCKGDGAEKLE